MLPIPAAILADPADRHHAYLVDLRTWAIERMMQQHGDQMAAGIMAALSWLSGRRGVGPLTDRPTPTSIDDVRAEYDVADYQRRARTGSAALRALGVEITLGIATGRYTTLIAAIEDMPDAA